MSRTQHPSPESLCCESMQAALELNCSEHDDPFDCPDSLIAYHEGLNQFALIVHDGGRDVVLIRYCPWCGTALAGIKAAMAPQDDATGATAPFSVPDR